MWEQRMIFEESPIADLYERFAPTVLKYIRRNVVTREQAEDVLLDVFVAALEKQDFARLGEQQQLAWLRRVAHNKFIDTQRRALRHPLLPLEMVEGMLTDDELAPEQVVLRQEAHELLKIRLAALPVAQREVLRLRFAGGLRCAEIGQRINKSEGAVRIILSRTLNLLRSIYTKNSEEAGNE
ncbi:RNA polymerase sigma factor [Ktedonobacter racemifer]|uniref:RNA polymerase, sigma-24 subunit, ECF subfamily n=1 Tax=Ktedonobacter racemifer DSM 44963 TaxID=485913 RepID=D6U4E9_KTERA|nr:sigma-70 family RNA polymerase sigma factor [Ktedonobacter racemifer]EFH81379.1 RNA polymerase, sigma-24 subunit, ECF subfamily [Ktedonobacter racemifer DSM 44963]